ncbi:eukaryotic peptide chain release factor GTP-binding subunit ERF3B-like protein [Babesia ovata]|uniref:Eukaryotic peptide chain release factor GTP-binding subunit ERF3B-like protein n=1 Tax=Babesia ovata TaxID=189622 RepID=A0A2H6KFW6_9APIC|nr:eukaryotic peptide chain release factor GTP-binding subunit ERF3B-like protein [Babesia ovata]GBE61888.1 eukaryotic peptide chain release factor GTP-binding subunit ERF3B-like protein [Babesia ovata]
MAILRRLAVFAAVLLFAENSAAKHLHRNTAHRLEVALPGNHRQKQAYVKPNTVSEARHQAKLSMTPPSADSRNDSKEADKIEEARDVMAEDFMRGRASVEFPAGNPYAKIDPQKSLIGAILVFGFYLLGTMLYNYIRKVTEQNRVEQALRDYEEEKEHYIEYGETVDVAGSGS